MSDAGGAARWIDKVVITFGAMDGLTVQDAARVTGWSARMLRYVEQIGLVVPPRSEGGYRIYRPRDLERLAGLRRLMLDQGVRLDDLGFAQRLRRDAELREAVDAWFAEPATPAIQLSPLEWLVATPRSHERLRYVA